MSDLLEDYDNLPTIVKDVFSTYDQNKDDYHQCQRIEGELKEIGYSVEWGLDASFYNLREIIK